MDEKQNRQGGSAGPVLIVAAILILLPVFYVLSIGPMAWLDSKGLFSETTHTVLECFYFPLALAVENEVPIVGPALMNYVEWCGG